MPMFDAETAEIELACQRLMVRYARAVDTADAEAFAAVFAEDGQLILPKGTRSGRVAIRRGIEQRDPLLRSQHVITNMLVEPEGADAAKGSCYLTLFRNQPLEEGAGAGLAVALVAIYHDEFRLTDDGWRIARRELEVVFQ